MLMLLLSSVFFTRIRFGVPSRSRTVLKLEYSAWSWSLIMDYRTFSVRIRTLNALFVVLYLIYFLTTPLF
jgi:hypothetical protein